MLVYQVILIADLSDKFTCTNCQEDISGMRVRCNECTDFELCLQVGGRSTITAMVNQFSYSYWKKAIR